MQIEQDSMVTQNGSSRMDRRQEEMDCLQGSSGLVVWVGVCSALLHLRLLAMSGKH